MASHTHYFLIPQATNHKKVLLACSAPCCSVASDRGKPFDFHPVPQFPTGLFSRDLNIDSGPCGKLWRPWRKFSWFHMIQHPTVSTHHPPPGTGQ